MDKAIFTLLLLSVSSFTYSSQLTPTFKEVELKEFTSLQLEVMPDAGTQLIFPFQLDNPDLLPALKIRLTNTNGWSVPTDPKDIQVLLKGQNTLSILGMAGPHESNQLPPIYLGNLFITIGGYNLSIGLKTTLDTTKHVSNIIFKVDDVTREHMVESAVKRKTESLDKEYKQKFSEIDQRAKELSLTHISKMVTKNKDTTKFKEEGRFAVGSESLIAYADELVNFGNEYFVLLFELTNKNSSDYTIESLQLYGLEEESEKALEGIFNCDSRLNADTNLKCSFASTSKAVKTANRLKLKVLSDRGEGEFTW